MRKSVILLVCGLMTMGLFGCGSKEIKENSSVENITQADDDVKEDKSLKESKDLSLRKGDENPQNTEGHMLFDFYTATVATGDGESPYHEITVNEVDGAVYVNVYTGDRNLGTTDSHKAYIGIPQLYSDLCDVVREYEMTDWNDNSGISETGGLRVVKFLNPEEKLTRVSNENMPQNGNEAFSKISNILNGYFETNPKCVLEK